MVEGYITSDFWQKKGFEAITPIPAIINVSSLAMCKNMMQKFMRMRELVIEECVRLATKQARLSPGCEMDKKKLLHFWIWGHGYISCSFSISLDDSQREFIGERFGAYVFSSLFQHTWGKKCFDFVRVILAQGLCLSFLFRSIWNRSLGGNRLGNNGKGTQAPAGGHMDSPRSLLTTSHVQLGWGRHGKCKNNFDDQTWQELQ